MSTQILTALLVVFVLGMFVGSNLGVLLMCLMQVSKRDLSDEMQPAPVAVQVEG